MKKLSIIIPVLNQPIMTSECIDSIIKNTKMEHEIILVDNGSTEQISDEYKKKVKYIRNEENIFFGPGCNLGAANANNEILCFLNNDILLTPEWDDCVNYLDEHPEVGIVGPKLIYPNNTIQHAGVQVTGTIYNGAIFDHRYRHFPIDYPAANKIREYQCITGACFFIRKQDFDAVGGFERGYHNGYEDNDLCFKVRFNLNKKVIYYPNSMAIHKESITSSKVPYQEAPNKVLFYDRWHNKLVEDKTKFDRMDNEDKMKTIVIYKVCEKELKKENFKHERPEWFSKKNCFTSFYNSVKKCKHKIDVYVIFDGDMNGDFATFLKSHDVNFIPVNIKNMYLANQYCYKFAYENDFDFCYFLEDDYLHHPEAMNILMEGLMNLENNHLLTLYDHPDRYTRIDDLTKDKESLFITESSHWRTGESTTHTFALSKKTLMNNMDIFNDERFFTDDRNLHRELYLKKNVRLVSCVPGKSTHVNKYFYTPFVDWSKV